MSNITIHRNRYKLDFKSFVFPAGEISVQLNLNTSAFAAKTCFWERGQNEITICSRIHNSNDVVELLMVVDALRHACDFPIRLFLPYVPYGRQDRICNKGESHSLRVFCDLINSLNFKEVIIADPHSDVCEALIDNVKIIKQFGIINKFPSFNQRILKGVKFVSPDAGANKKVAKIAGYFNHESFIRGDKLRNLQTGEIKETIIYCDDLKGQDVCIIDDIAEGSMTFIKLAEKLKEKNCGKIILYVTFGIFSKGLDVVYNSGISEIYTTNGYRSDLVSSDKLFVLNLEEGFEII